MAPSEEDAVDRWLSDVRAEQDAAARARVRRLVDQAAEEGTLLAACLDLAERSAAVTIETVAGTRLHGVVTGAGRDFVVLAGDRGDGVRTVVTLAAVTSMRTAIAGARAPGAAREPTGRTSLADVLTELCAERAHVGVITAGGQGTLSGELTAVGADVVTLRSDGDPPVLTYVSLVSLVAVLVPSG